MNANILPGKTIVITGATSGIGLATAEILVQQGAGIIGVGRSAERCQSAENHLRQLNPAAHVTYLVADLSLQSQVRALALRIREIVAKEGSGGLDGLVNNAGTFSFWQALTPEGFERQWAVNHLAPFLLTLELLPLLQSAPMARVVTISSGYHSAHLDWNDIQLRRHYDGLKAYAQTKLANILFTLELDARLGNRSTVRAFAADPGLVKTEIGFKGVPPLLRWIWEWRRSGGITPEESARGVAFLVTEPTIQNSPEIFWRHRAPQRVGGKTLDRQAVWRLWEISSQMCGLQDEVASSEESKSLAVSNNHGVKNLVLITGATGGLGKAFAVECASRGWDLFLTDLRAEALETLASALRRTYGVQVMQHACDLTDIASRTDLFEYIRAERLQFRALINVAGLDFEGPFRERSREEIRTIVRLNIEAALEMMHALLKFRDPNVPFRIINVASAAAFSPLPIKAMYGASKRFLLDFSLALREEVRDNGVTVTVLCPAGMPTIPETIDAIERQGWIGLITTRNIGSVAAQTLDAALKGKAVVVPGFFNRQLKRVVLLIPGPLLVFLLCKLWQSARRKLEVSQMLP